jgi:hypothetical protein
MFELRNEEVIEDWRKLHINELYNLQSSSSKITMIKSRRMRLEELNACRILVGKPERKEFTRKN